jgi:amino acid transporter
MPFAMAEDGFLSSVFTKKSTRFGTPAVAILFSGCLYALLSVNSMTRLITVYVWLRVATSLMTVVSAWRLRKTKPNMPRAFVIPGGRKGLLYSVGAPLLMGFVALLGSDPIALIFGPAAIALGPIAYLALRHVRKRQLAS